MNAISSLLGGLERFLDADWQRGPCLQRRVISPGLKLPELAAFEDRLRTGELPRDRVRVLHEGAVLVGDALGPGPGVCPERVADRLSRGATVSVNRFEDLDVHAQALSQAFAQELGAPNCLNAYYTPAGRRGLAPHTDAQDAFILQLGGAKAWEVYPPPVALPFVGGNGQDADIQGKQPLLAVTVEAGDLLYVPRGFAHRAAALPGAPSLHLTVTVAVFQWFEVLHALVDRAAARDPRLRGAVGLDWRGGHRSPPTDCDAVDTALAAIQAPGDLDAVLDGLASRIRHLHGLATPEG